MATTKRSKVTEPAPPAVSPAEVMPAESPDQALVREDAVSIGSFLGNMPSFFRSAAALERENVALLAEAKKLTAPKTLEEDADIQAFIRNRGNVQKKKTADFWSVRLLFHNVHRRMGDAFKRADDPVAQSLQIAQKLHNDYTEEAKRAAAREQERQRQESERLAREQQEREAAQLEADAVKAEEASGDLSEREVAFVDYYTNPLNAVERGDAGKAASRAGFKDGLKQGARLLGLVKIANAIKARQDAAAMREQAAAVRQQPVQVETPVVQAAVSRVGGHDRTTWGAEVLDDAALIAAVFEGKYGIPRDVLMVDHSKVNSYGKDMKELIDRWPGVRHTKKTKTI